MNKCINIIEFNQQKNEVKYCKMKNSIYRLQYPQSIQRKANNYKT